MIRITVQTAKLIDNLRRCLDLSQNNVPLFRAFVGPEGSQDEFTLRGSINKNFASTSDPISGESWDALKDSTVKAKSKKYGSAMTPLVANGTMYESLVGANAYTVFETTNTNLRYGTSVPYGGYHMTGTKWMQARRYIGLSDGLKGAFIAAWKQYTIDAIEGRQ